MIIIKISMLIPLSISLATLVMSSASWAAGTAAGTNINNTATINYSVNGTSQTEIESSEKGNIYPGRGNGAATTFKVDKKIDLLVTASTGTNIVPSTYGAPTSLSFTLKNKGNSTQSFNLIPSQVASTGTDDVFDTSACAVTTPALPVSLTAEESTPVTVQCTVPASSRLVKNGAKSMVDLLAEESTGLTEMSRSGHHNTKHSATNTYTINTTDLTVSKTSAITKTSINGAYIATNAKHTSGATIVYTIKVSNGMGAASATGIILTDTVPDELTISAASIVVADAASTTITPSGQLVTSSEFSLNAEEVATLTITTTVN